MITQCLEGSRRKVRINMIDSQRATELVLVETERLDLLVRSPHGTCCPGQGQGRSVGHITLPVGSFSFAAFRIFPSSLSSYCQFEPAHFAALIQFLDTFKLGFKLMDFCKSQLWSDIFGLSHGWKLFRDLTTLVMTNSSWHPFKIGIIG